MDKFFDRLGDLLSSLLGGGRQSAGPEDPDERAAWEELNAYLDDEEPRGKGPSEASQRFSADFWERRKLRQDYANLGVPFGSSFEEVRKAYKRLLQKHHPDRNSGDPERLREATELTKKINISYRRIRDFEEGKGDDSRPETPK